MSVATPSRSVHPDSDRARIPSASVLNTPGAVGSGEKGGGNGGDGCEASELCAETSRYNAMERRTRLWKNELGMLCSDDVTHLPVHCNSCRPAVLRGGKSRDTP